MSYDPNYGGRQGQGGGGGGGIGRRLMPAIVIAVIALIMYLSQGQENPVTGKTQYVSLSTDQEIKLGLQSAPEMERKMGGVVSASDPQSKEVAAMGKYLVDHTEAKKSPWKFQFHLINDSKTVNAFALPGGQIFITLGLLNKLQNEAQLAGVLSHEMGHVIERHTAQQMAKSEFGQRLVMAVVTGASDPNSNMQNGAYAAAAVVNQMAQLHFGRKDESQADLWGTLLMSKAGYDPRAMIDVLEILKKEGGSGGQMLEIFQTHPNPDLRIEQIKEHLKEHPPATGLTEGRPLSEVYKSLN